MYTVQHLYQKVLEGVDKIGSDLWTLAYVMNRTEAATYDFIGETVKYMENTQEIRDDLRTLYVPFQWEINLLPSLVGAAENFYGAVLPTAYLHLMSAEVIDDNVTVRDTRIIRHGQNEIYRANPNKKAAPEYPTLVMYANYCRVDSGSGGSPKYIKGFYLRKPNIWVYNEDDDTNTEIAIDLPDNVVDKIIKDVINDIFISSGDPRAQVQYQIKEQYRNRGTV